MTAFLYENNRFFLNAYLFCLELFLRWLYFGFILKILDASFEVTLGSQSSNRFSVNTTEFGQDGLVFHQINVSSPLKPIIVDVYPNDVNATFGIFVNWIRFDSVRVRLRSHFPSQY